MKETSGSITPDGIKGIIRAQRNGQALTVEQEEEQVTPFWKEED